MLVDMAQDSNPKTKIESQRPELINLVRIDMGEIEVVAHIQFQIRVAADRPPQAAANVAARPNPAGMY